MQFYKFPSIESFHNKVKEGSKKFAGELTFIKKTKLHGSNAAIVMHPEDGVYAQSRNRVITQDDDNYGFAEFVDSLNLKHVHKDKNKVIIIYGEWVGLGINNVDSITKLDKKIFCPFSVVFYDIENEEYSNIIVKSDEIKILIKVIRLYDCESIVVIDDIETIKINFNEESTLNDVVDTLNGWVDDISKCDEWVKEKFSIEGSGEGFVLAPDTHDYAIYKSWMFKIKTENHNVNKMFKPVSLNAEVSKDVDDFIIRFLTQARLEQAVTELGGEDSINIKRLGDFMKWIGQDVKKESSDEIEVSGFKWSDVSKRLNNKAKIWFMSKCK